ncbi:MAG: diacylglycerol kinase [Candidatus Omnitrophota bacterium]
MLLKTHKILNSFNAAIEGFLYVVRTQRNMRIHFLLALIVILFGISINLTRIEIMILCITIALVLITEMLNTALEIILTKAYAAYSYWVKTVKDIAAGAVLVASINAIIIGYFLFFSNVTIHAFATREILKISESDWHISFFILLSLVGIVVIGKTFFHRGKPLRGGMPSGHTSVAFSIWMLVALISQNTLLIFTVLLLAVMIAQSRVSRHYHTPWEVLVGAVLGSVATVLLYRLFTG